MRGARLRGPRTTSVTQRENVRGVVERANRTPGVPT